MLALPAGSAAFDGARGVAAKTYLSQVLCQFTAFLSKLYFRATVGMVQGTLRPVKMNLGGNRWLQ